MAVELVELAGLAGAWRRRSCLMLGRGSGRSRPASSWASGVDASRRALQEPRRVPNGPAPSGPLATSSIRGAGLEPGDRAPGPLDLGLDGRELRASSVARRAAGPRRDDELGALGRLDDQGPRGDQAATSASPNCSSRPKTLRSTGWRQTSLRSSK